MKRKLDNKNDNEPPFKKQKTDSKSPTALMKHAFNAVGKMLDDGLLPASARNYCRSAKLLASTMNPYTPLALITAKQYNLFMHLAQRNDIFIPEQLEETVKPFPFPIEENDTCVDFPKSGSSVFAILSTFSNAPQDVWENLLVLAANHQNLKVFPLWPCFKVLIDRNSYLSPLAIAAREDWVLFKNQLDDAKFKPLELCKKVKPFPFMIPEYGYDTPNNGETALSLLRQHTQNDLYNETKRYIHSSLAKEPDLFKCFDLEGFLIINDGQSFARANLITHEGTPDRFFNDFFRPAVSSICREGLALPDGFIDSINLIVTFDNNSFPTTVQWNYDENNPAHEKLRLSINKCIEDPSLYDILIVRRPGLVFDCFDPDGFIITNEIPALAYGELITGNNTPDNFFDNYFKPAISNICQKGLFLPNSFIDNIKLVEIYEREDDDDDIPNAIAWSYDKDNKAHKNLLSLLNKCIKDPSLYKMLILKEEEQRCLVQGLFRESKTDKHFTESEQGLSGTTTNEITLYFNP